MQLCSDMNVDPSDVKVLIMAWQFNAEQQGTFSLSSLSLSTVCLRADIDSAFRLASLLPPLLCTSSPPSFLPPSFRPPLPPRLLHEIGVEER
eukprot:3050896-Rhodomonas_salina.1